MIIQRLFENRAFLFSSSLNRKFYYSFIRGVFGELLLLTRYNVVRSLDELDDRLAIHCKNPVNDRDTFFFTLG